jgi:glutathione S-transferase
MKLFGYAGAPNPRKAEIFLAEKGIDFELITVDLSRGEHRSEAFLQKNSEGKIPVLETENGDYLSESTAICRYLEALHPTPPLFGRTPLEIGMIAMRNRHIELGLWSQIGTSWVNGPIVGRLGRFEQNPLAKKHSDQGTHAFYDRLNRELAGSDFVAGDAFSMADISLWVAIDFATRLVNLAPSAHLTTLMTWFEVQSQRPSIAPFVQKTV